MATQRDHFVTSPAIMTALNNCLLMVKDVRTLNMLNSLQQSAMLGILSKRQRQAIFAIQATLTKASKGEDHE